MGRSHQECEQEDADDDEEEAEMTAVPRFWRGVITWWWLLIFKVPSTVGLDVAGAAHPVPQGRL